MTTRVIALVALFTIFFSSFANNLYSIECCSKPPSDSLYQAVDFVSFKLNELKDSLPLNSVKKTFIKGEASYYADQFDGRKTASGIVFDNDKMYAAHRKLPFGTKVRLYVGSRSVIVTIVDRGPFANRHKRIFDLSQAAFEKLSGSLAKGTINIKATVIS
ncbi:MAG: septal ring lytic transglycosylase RlpA family protein [Patescibacteria group bacterium]|nr:septal ring lytic transglycosylase RlpA family protein [Patescibacteria group bacterium]